MGIVLWAKKYFGSRHINKILPYHATINPSHPQAAVCQRGCSSPPMIQPGTENVFTGSKNKCHVDPRYVVLRHDDRGYGKSTGNTYEALDADFSADAAAALKWLRSQKNIDVNRVGFISHSQGSSKAVLAEQIEKPDFMIFIAGGLEGTAELLLRQGRDMAQASGVSVEKLKRMKQDLKKIIDIIASSKTAMESKDKIEKFIISEGGGIILAKKISAEYTKPWIVAELKSSKNTFEKIDGKISTLIKDYDEPILALYGEKDLLVSAKVEIPVITTLLSNNKSRAIVLPGLNHFMQPFPETKEPRQVIIEACYIETTFDATALKAIGDWLRTLHE